MTLVWQSIFYGLVAEVAAFVFLCLPLPTTWRIGFGRLLVKVPLAKWLAIFWSMFLVVHFAQELMEARRMNDRLQQKDINPLGAISNHDLERKFRAERNLYISGFSLLLLVILNRFLALLHKLHGTETQAGSEHKQAQSQEKELAKLREQLRAAEETLKKETAKNK
eukprot:m.477190 g.477190  ORF g.477190 m.477190 type:complete len:166 (+) comp20774_c0_seq1:2187-2684(+)